MSITPETSAWVRELLQQEIEKAVAPLRQELDQVDDWANGVFAALLDVVLALLKSQPELANDLAPLWRFASERYDHLEQSPPQADDIQETQHLLEARKMLYRQLAALGAWPSPPSQG